MAITISQEPSGVSPAFNDTYIIYSSTLADTRSTVDVGGRQFQIFPDTSGTYYFNVKKIVQSIINTNKFVDNLDVSEEGVWGFNDSSLFTTISFTISVHSDDASEQVIRTYKFNKAVYQPGDEENTNDYAILTPSDKLTNNYYITYFEGYPFDIALKNVTAGDQLSLKNNNSQDISPTLVPASNGAYRIVIDKGTSNMTSTGFLPMLDIVNRIDIRESGDVKATLNLKKVNNTCGVYLKWFNSEGNYSYWLFEPYYRDTVKTSDGYFIGTNNFNLIYGNTSGDLITSGKQGTRSMNLRTKVDKNEIKQLRSIFTSPRVQLWSSQDPYVEGRWIDVSLDSSSFNITNKKEVQPISLTIELPVLNTQML